MFSILQFKGSRNRSPRIYIGRLTEAYICICQSKIHISQRIDKRYSFELICTCILQISEKVVYYIRDSKRYKTGHCELKKKMNLIVTFN